jgi:hypothetical protein
MRKILAILLAVAVALPLSLGSASAASADVGDFAQLKAALADQSIDRINLSERISVTGNIAAADVKGTKVIYAAPSANHHFLMARGVSADFGGEVVLDGGGGAGGVTVQTPGDWFTLKGVTVKNVVTGDHVIFSRALGGATTTLENVKVIGCVANGKNSNIVYNEGGPTDDGALSLKNCVIAENTVSGSNSFANGVISFGDLVIEDSVVSCNTGGTYSVLAYSQSHQNAKLTLIGDVDITNGSPNTYGAFKTDYAAWTPKGQYFLGDSKGRGYVANLNSADIPKTSDLGVWANDWKKYLNQSFGGHYLNNLIASLEKNPGDAWKLKGKFTYYLNAPIVDNVGMRFLNGDDMVTELNPLVIAPARGSNLESLFKFGAVERSAIFGMISLKAPTGSNAKAYILVALGHIGNVSLQVFQDNISLPLKKEYVEVNGKTVIDGDRDVAEYNDALPTAADVKYAESLAFEANGQPITGVSQLAPGENTVTVTATNRGNSLSFTVKVVKSGTAGGYVITYTTTQGSGTNVILSNFALSPTPPAGFVYKIQVAKNNNFTWTTIKEGGSLSYANNNTQRLELRAIDASGAVIATALVK